MEFMNLPVTMEASLPYTLLSLLLLILILFRFSARRKLPPSPFLSLPVIGHLYLLKFPLHRNLHSLSQKLGPVFSLRFANRLVVVVSSPAVAEECFTKNDVVLANRPRLIIAKYIGYNYTSLVAAPYGDHWRNLRRFTTVEIFSTARLNVFQSIREDEIRHMVRKLCRNSCQNFATVELRPLLFDLTLNNIMRMVSGKRYFGQDEDNEEARRFRELKDDIFSVSGVSNPADFFPLLRWFDFGGLEKKLKGLAKQMDDFLQGLIEEHRGRKNSNTMIDHLLSLRESEPEFYTDNVIKAVIVVMLLAGTDTSSVTVEWAMSLLLNHPDKLDKARAEIDSVVGAGEDRLISESDISKLPYLQHVISETMRLFPAAPLLVPHVASADCKIGGYDVTRGAMVLVNAWAIHRDPAVWDDPTSFRPERFEGGEIGTPKLLPFGMGRRSCPGNMLALRVVTATVGALIQCFEWRRISEEMVDLSEGKGVSIPKAVPLEAMCKAREVVQRVLD